MFPRIKHTEGFPKRLNRRSSLSENSWALVVYTTSPGQLSEESACESVLVGGRGMGAHREPVHISSCFDSRLPQCAPPGG